VRGRDTDHNSGRRREPRGALQPQLLCDKIHRWRLNVDVKMMHAIKDVFLILHSIRNCTVKLVAAVCCECHKLVHFQKVIKKVGIRKGEQGVVA